MHYAGTQTPNMIQFVGIVVASAPELGGRSMVCTGGLIVVNDYYILILVCQSYSQRTITYANGHCNPATRVQ